MNQLFSGKVDDLDFGRPFLRREEAEASVANIKAHTQFPKGHANTRKAAPGLLIAEAVLAPPLRLRGGRMWYGITTY